MFWGWKTGAICGKNGTSRTGASTPCPALDIGNLNGGYDMPDVANIIARGDSASAEQQDNWNSIGELAKALAEKAGRK